MLSLPMIPPRADASLWPSQRHTEDQHDDPSTSPPNPSSQRHASSHHHPHHNPHHSRPHQQSALLAALTQDENTIEQRKLNVRRFGAGWLRPPGIAKTLQAMKDEELEKEEQELMQRREQVMLDLAAAQQDAANAEARAGQGADPTERDLDDEVPNAESELNSSDDDDEEEEDEGGEMTVPFNEDSFIEGSMLAAEVRSMLDMEEAEMAGVLQDERDLDEDVPEAGEYEHTDSELEDEDSEDEEADNSHAGTGRSRASRRRTSGRRSSGLPSGGFAGGGASSMNAGRGVDLGGDLGHGRSSFGLDESSSIVEGSSFLRSSPAVSAGRGSLRDRFLGAVRGGRRG